MKHEHLWTSTIVVALVLTQMSVTIPVKAQDTTIKTKKQAELLIPRPAMAPMKSTDAKDVAMDTLDTADPLIKILLFPDFTWKYFKNPAYAIDDNVFKEYWSHDAPDPYHVGTESLPDEIALWIVDSLSGYHCPNKIEVYSKFGYRHGRRHQGVDLPLDTGTPVYSAFDGKVRMAKKYRGYGNLVVIRHSNGLETFYGHLSKIYVQEDQWVNAGSIIGLGGSTGHSTGPHLHFETRYKGYAFDPEWLIDFSSGTLRHRLFVLKQKYLDANSKYVPESDEEEIDIIQGDTKDKEEAVKKAAAEKKAALASARKYYTVRNGDNLGSIARKHHTSVRSLCKLNGISQRTTLRVGRKLRVK